MDVFIYMWKKVVKIEKKNICMYKNVTYRCIGEKVLNFKQGAKTISPYLKVFSIYK